MKARLPFLSFVCLLVLLGLVLSGCASTVSRALGGGSPNYNSAEELHASLWARASYYGLGNFSPLDVARIPLQREARAGSFAHVNFNYDKDPASGQPTRLHYQRIVLNPVRDAAQATLLQLAVVHAFAHLFLAQRYPYISQAQTDAAFVIREGHAEWLRHRWLLANAGAGAAREYANKTPAYRRAYMDFVYHYTEGGRGERLLWEKLDAQELRLAPAGYRIHPIPIAYPQ